MVSEPDFDALPQGLDFTETKDERRARIKLIADKLYTTNNRRDRLAARARVRKALKRIKI